MRNFEESTLYCINCGNKAMPIQRRRGRQKEKFHRKKLYCWHCKKTVNHVECKTLEDVDKFKEDFENGVYAEEAYESLKECERLLCLAYT